MDFNNIFTSNETMGIFIKETAKKQIRETLKDYKDDEKLMFLKMQMQCIQEMIQEIEYHMGRL